MLFSKSPTTDASRTPIPPITADPEYQRAAAVYSAIQAKLAANQREVERHALELEFAKIAGRPKSGRTAMLWERLQELRAEISEARKPAVIPEDSRPEIEAALEVVRGEKPAEPDDFAHRKARLERENVVLQAGANAASLALDEVTKAISERLAEEDKTEHEAKLLKLYRALQQVSRIADELRDDKSARLVAGYTGFEQILRLPFIRSVSMLGSERSFDSEMSSLRRLLEDWRIL